MDEIAPMKDVRTKYRTEPWMNEEILELMHARDRALRFSNQNKHDTVLRKEYSKLRNKVNKIVKQTKANFFQDKIDEHKTPLNNYAINFKPSVIAIKIKKNHIWCSILKTKNALTIKKLQIT